MSIDKKFDDILAYLEKVTETLSSIDEQLTIIIVRELLKENRQEPISPEDYE